MLLIICFTQIVVCAANSKDCTDIIKHGQMKGLVLATNDYHYVADFSDAAKYKNFDGDFTNVEVPKNKCIRYRPEEQK